MMAPVIIFIVVILILAIGISVAGALLGLLLTLLAPVALLFTGVMVYWFLTKDFSDEKGSDPKQ